MKKIEVGCHRKDCWGCEDDLRRRAALSIKDRFLGHLSGRAVCYTVLTTPEHRRGAAAHYPTWDRWRKELIAWMQEELSLAWAVERADPAGKCADSELSGVYCDCSKCSKWHPHLNLLWVRSTGRGMLSEWDLFRLKSRWAEIIGAEHVWDGDYVRPVVDVFHKFVLDPSLEKNREKRARLEGKLWHLFQYMGRPWPAWQRTARRHIRIRWYGQFPKKLLSEEEAERRMRRHYRDLEKHQGDAKLEKRIQKKIDRLRTHAECRCGCGVTYYPKPEKLCSCCGERTEVMACLDAEEAAYWEEQGPKLARAEMRRRRREGDGVFHCRPAPRPLEPREYIARVREPAGPLFPSV